MQNHPHFLRYQYTPRTHVRERPLHRFIIILSLLFVFLLVIESVAMIVLGAWHLTIPRLESVRNLSSAIYQRELAFGILLVIVGSAGVFISILGLIAFFTLRLIFLRLFSYFLWILLIVGMTVGVIGIIFASQVDVFMRENNNLMISQSRYGEEKFMLGMNGGLALFMSLTMIVGVIIVRCLTGDVSVYSNAHAYFK